MGTMVAGSRVAQDQERRLAGGVRRHVVPWAMVSFQQRGADAHGLSVTANRQKTILYQLAVVLDGGLQGHAPSVLPFLVVGELPVFVVGELRHGYKVSLLADAGRFDVQDSVIGFTDLRPFGPGSAGDEQKDKQQLCFHNPAAWYT